MGESREREGTDLVEVVKESVHLVRLTSKGLDLGSLPPSHVLGLLNEVITHPARDGQEGHGGFYKVLLPAHLGKHMLHLILYLFITSLLVAGGVRIHLVNPHSELAHAEQVQQTSMLAGLTLHPTHVHLAQVETPRLALQLSKR
jgi:hypothetical protein